MATAVRTGPSSVLCLVRALDASDLTCPLWLVTKGAQAIDGQIDSAGVMQAPMWGMGRVLHQESLTLNARLADLDPSRARQDVAALCDELLHDGYDEDQIAWRGGVRLAPRLQPAAGHAGTFPATFRANASYLITGGLGALGALARWMAGRGARRVILMGRSRLPERDQWALLDDTDPRREQVAAIRAIEALGTNVELASLDVADRGSLKEFVAKRYTPACRRYAAYSRGG